MMKFNKRIVDRKRHTLGYVLTNGKRLTRKEAMVMVQNGKIRGVRLVSTPSGGYLRSNSKTALYDLPHVFNTRRRNRTVNAS